MENPIDDRSLAEQLSIPTGTPGIQTAERLNQNNDIMNRFVIDILSCSDYDKVLEIDPAKEKNAPYVLTQARGIKYTGLDVPTTMIDEETYLFDFPFPSNTFDKIFTVNTLYFWPEPDRQLKEIRRILKPDGRFCLSIGSKAFMEQFSFSTFGFILYSPDDLCCLLVKNGFLLHEITIKNDEPIKLGEIETFKEQIVILASKSYLSAKE